MKNTPGVLLFLFCGLLMQCNNPRPQPIITQPEGFVEFIKNFDTLEFPLIISDPDFMKENMIEIPAFKRISLDDMKLYMRMDSLIPYPVFYYGQLPMKDSVYYLINYFEVMDKKNPSKWWTLMKFDFYGKLLNETNIAYCLKDSNKIEERFCKIDADYRCFYLETSGKYNAHQHKVVTDTLITSRSVNLLDPDPSGNRK